MDDFLGELIEGNVTYKDLYKLHTGHGVDGLSDDPDTNSSDSESEMSKNDSLKPPLYTYEELTQNLVGAERPLETKLYPKLEKEDQELTQNLVDKERILETELNPNSRNEASESDCSVQGSNLGSLEVNGKNSSQQNSTPENKSLENVAQKLSYLITEDYCFVCLTSGHKHYKQEGHYKNVIRWLEVQTQEILQSVDIKLIFCQICNLTLSGNEEAEKHYEQKDHQQRAKSFCATCLRVIDAIDMPSHCRSIKHLFRLKSTVDHKSETKENAKNPEAAKNKVADSNLQHRKENGIPKPSMVFLDLPLENASTGTKSYASVLKSRDAQGTTEIHMKIIETNKPTPLTPRTLTPRDRYESPVRGGRVNPLAIMLLEQLRRTYCNLCNEAVHKGKGYHYKTQQHQVLLRKWIKEHGFFFGYNMSNIASVMCIGCNIIFPTFGLAQRHYKSTEHEKVSKHYCDVCMTYDNTGIHEHQDEAETADQEGIESTTKSNVICEPGVYIRNSLKSMLTPDHCYICQTDNDNSHYLSREHIKVFRSWLNVMIRNTGTYLPQEVIFCEYCNLVLLGTEESISHYETKEHYYGEQTYCAMCIFRGSAEEFLLHTASKEHVELFDTFRLLNSPKAEDTFTIPLPKEQGRQNKRSKKKEKLPTEHAKVDANPVAMQENVDHDNTSAKHVETNGVSSTNVEKVTDKTNNLIAPNPHTAKGRETNGENEAGVFIAEKLQEMLSECYCHICHMSIKNNNHYAIKTHITNIREWLDGMIKNSGVKVDQQVIFCEDCNMVLSGRNHDNHYKTEAHLENQMGYCSVCIYRGSPDEVSSHHHCEEHNENLKILLIKDVSTNKKIPNRLPSKVIENSKDIISDIEKEERIKPKTKNELEENTSNENSPKSNEHTTKKYDDIETTNISDKHVNLLHLGLRLMGQYFPDKVVVKSKEYEICKNIFAEHCQLANMLETLPVDVCLSYLRRFNREVCMAYRQFLNIPDENASTVISIVDNQNGQIIQQDDIFQTTDILAREMTKLRTIVTTFLNENCSISTLNKVQRLIMSVRNFKNALKVMRSDRTRFKVKRLFQFTNERYPSGLSFLKEYLDIAPTDICKYILKSEVEQIHDFINNQQAINPNIVLQFLLQFNNKLLKEDGYKTKILSVSSDYLKRENDSDLSFQNAVECLCEGWCTQKNRTNL